MSKYVYCPRCGERIPLSRNVMPVGLKSKKQRQLIVYKVGVVMFGIVLFACLAMAATNSFPTF